MEELKSYVELLFKPLPQFGADLELKEEILSNLEAKVEDLTAQGMEKEEAVRQAKASITSVDGSLTATVWFIIIGIKWRSPRWRFFME